MLFYKYTANSTYLPLIPIETKPASVLSFALPFFFGKNICRKEEIWLGFSTRKRGVGRHNFAHQPSIGVSETGVGRGQGSYISGA
jgi:hypothetical protein